MKTNADMTLYSKSINPTTRTEVYTRTEYVGVFWENRKAANVLRSGLLEADSVSVYIPSQTPGLFPIKVGDILVKWIVKDEITGSFTITDLKAKYPNVVTVRSVDTKDFGRKNMQHVQIGAS